ncbi:hypothetical protein N7468_004446 [Penicillium chermesinum]|uniref:Ubiquinone/menaquinone biosynthesis-related protein n=1 Tax=Penicillium chermesinum TaxID=63820 RepID=A0A9W9TSS1_9EURO|nr:uncharacterized protein N7468_004446 [Penicillium chermesinum]KAJ5239827.1 hypothetical protein N7468_004446 [Penicillium chermesinum]
MPWGAKQDASRSKDKYDDIQVASKERAQSRTQGPPKDEQEEPRPHYLPTPPIPTKAQQCPPRLMTFFGISVLGLSTYCGYLYTSYTRQVAASRALEIDPDVSDRYNDSATRFDAEIELDEKLMRLGAKRASLIALARGDVLEVSCGTGRNIPYYELGMRRGIDEKGRATVKGCRSVTFTDLSAPMVEVAKKKFAALHPGAENVVFRVRDAKEVEVDIPGLKPSRGGTGSEGVHEGVTPGSYYDTVVQTMGLCSMPDPVGTLRHLGEITEPEHGRILLLEHGRSYYGWLNTMLDNLATAHANRYGCWWNRDIGAIVKESGLEIVEEKRYHFGTTWWLVLRPKKTGQGLSS